MRSATLITIPLSHYARSSWGPRRTALRYTEETHAPCSASCRGHGCRCSGRNRSLSARTTPSECRRSRPGGLLYPRELQRALKSVVEASSTPSWDAHPARASAQILRRTQPARSLWRARARFEGYSSSSSALTRTWVASHTKSRRQRGRRWSACKAVRSRATTRRGGRISWASGCTART